MLISFISSYLENVFVIFLFLSGNRAQRAPPTPAPTASGQRAPTACRKDGKPGEDERLTPGTPDNGAGQPSWGLPSAIPTASNAGSQGGTLWGRCWVPTPASAALRKYGQQNRATRSKDGWLGEGESLTPDTPHTVERYPSPPCWATSYHRRGVRHPAEHARHSASAGSPGQHTRAHSEWAADPDCLPQGHAAGGR